MTVAFYKVKKCLIDAFFSLYILTTGGDNLSYKLTIGVCLTLAALILLVLIIVILYVFVYRQKISLGETNNPLLHNYVHAKEKIVVT